MKSSVANYERLVFCLRIVAVDGTTVRFAGYPVDLTMSNGEIYAADSGYQSTDYTATPDMSASIVDYEGILAAAGIARADIAAGNWDNARGYAFATDWSAPVEDEEPVGVVLFGKVRIEDDRFVTELMHLIDAVNQSVGRTITPTCQWTLFDETLDGDVIPWERSRCTGPRGSSPREGPLIGAYTVTGSVTAVTSARVWQDSALVTSPLTYATDYFAAGHMRWLTGNNAGLRSKEIKASAEDGTISHFLAWPYEIQIGDTYEMVPGCRGRRAEDCRDKYSNAINFGGFSDLVTPSSYTKVGNS